MNILMLTGSPRKNGTSSLLADEFEKGAILAGNTVSRFNVAFLDINSCIGCNYCRRSETNSCVQKDDFGMIREKLLQSDAVVFITPVYYFDMSAQLKVVIDRFHAIGNELRKKSRKSMLIATCANPDAHTADVLQLHYDRILEYLCWEDSGRMIATGVLDREDIEKTGYPKQANKLANKLFDN